MESGAKRERDGRVGVGRGAHHVLHDGGHVRHEQAVLEHLGRAVARDQREGGLVLFVARAELQQIKQQTGQNWISHVHEQKVHEMYEQKAFKQISFKYKIMRIRAKISFIAFKKLPFFLANLADCIPGRFFRTLIQRPESSEITGKFTNLEKKFALAAEKYSEAI